MICVDHSLLQILAATADFPTAVGPAMMITRGFVTSSLWLRSWLVLSLAIDVDADADVDINMDEDDVDENIW